MENSNNGFVLSDELRALRDQVKRIIHDEIIPIENRLDPDRPRFPRANSGRSRAAPRPPVCGAWACRKNTAAAASALSTCAC